MKYLLQYFFILIVFGLLQTGCDRIPEEGTIVYDVDYPRADEVPTGGGGGSGGSTGGGSGGGSGGGGNGTTGSGAGTGGSAPDNSSIGYTIVESGDSTDVIEGATDDFTIVLNSQPTDNITITVTTPNTGDILISSGVGSLSADNTTLTLTFTPANWNQAQTVTVTGVEDATDEGGGTTAVNMTVSLTASADTDWVPADIPDSTVTANLTDSQATGPPSRITNLSAVAGVQQNTLSWTAASGAANHILYWSTSSPVSTSSDNFTLLGSDTSYVHGGLTAGTAYYYAIVPINGLGAAALSNEVSGTPSAFAGCTTSGTLTDTDSDLLVHYSFNNNLNDVKNSNGDGRYNLVNTGGTIKFAQGCGYGNAGYFDATTGYAYNNNFISDNIPTLTGNFTIAMWVNGDVDNGAYSAVYASGNKGYANHQIDVDSKNTPQLRLLMYNNGSQLGIEDPAQITNGQWYHVAAVHDDQNNFTLYKNGVAVQTKTAASTFTQFRVGTNRKGNNNWKGYIDEVKVFGRAFDGDDVKNACLLYGHCNNLTTPAKPDNLTAVVGVTSGQVDLSWNSVVGADNYTLYISKDNVNFTAISPVVTGTSYNSTREPDGTTPLSNGSTYYYYVVAHNAAGNSANSATASATPVAPNQPSVPTNLSATGGTAQVSLSWTASSGVVDNYTIYFSTDNSSYSLAGDNATGTSFVHTNRAHSTLYYYYVVANNSGGSSTNSSTVSATTNAQPQLSTPGTLSFTYSTGDNDDNVTVSWSAVTNANLYELWYNTAANPSSGGTQIDNISGTSYTIPSGISGNMQGYYFELRAKDSTGIILHRTTVAQIVTLPAVGLRCQGQGLKERIHPVKQA